MRQGQRGNECKRGGCKGQGRKSLKLTIKLGTGKAEASEGNSRRHQTKQTEESREQTADSRK
jgi:hypothetical protein